MPMISFGLRPASIIEYAKAAILIQNYTESRKQTIQIKEYYLMAKVFSVASWNVEHFGGSKNVTKINSAVNFIASQKADIVAIYEVESSLVFQPLIKAMPNYQFHITEGPQIQEILIGVKSGIAAYITQRVEFKSGQQTLRPGVLVTVYIGNEYYPLLFLHLKSMPDPKGFGLRDDMIRRACKFKGTLDKAAGGVSNYIFAGDLNVMGLDYPFKAHDISATDEIKELKRRAKYRKMTVLDKNSNFTWWNGSASPYPPGNLDHVAAANHLKFKQFGGKPIDVRGWPKEPTPAKKDAWIQKYSDHALLYFEINK